MGESEKTDLEVKGFHLIDVSSEDDRLIASFSGGLNHHQSSENWKEHRDFELLEPMDANEIEDVADTFGQREQLPQPSESLEPERTRKIGKCNMRKSLAWDSAFFTSAGVLDSEELSNMIEGAEKGNKHLLPGIQEDIRRSTDSISTLESDSLTLESLEADLFEDVRASIQKSSKMSNVAYSSGKAGPGETETQTIRSSKKVDLASQNRIKPKPASKKLSIGMQGSGKTIKQSSVCPQVTQIKPVARSGVSASSLTKPPKVIERANPISTVPTKRASLGANRGKMENDNAKNATVAGRGAPVSKIPGLGDSRRVVPRPTLSSKSSSSGSSTATKTQPTTSCSSFDSSSSASSDNIGKSPSNPVRRKINSSAVNPHSSGSVLKTPSRIALRNTTQSGNSRLSAYLTSTSKHSSSISPASSISEWSSESSSSNSTVNKRSNKSKASVDTGSPRRFLDRDAPRVSDFQNHSNDHFSDGHENQVSELPSQYVKKASTEIGTLSRPASTKPSGLRMPSPKIGFFDGVKSVVRSPNEGMQSHSGLPNGLPKIGTGICSTNGGSNKAKLGKLQPARRVMAIGEMKLDILQTASSLKPASPAPLQEPSNASTKVSSALRIVKNFPGMSPKVQKKTVGESQLKDEEVGAKEPDRAKHIPDSGLNAEKNVSLCALKWSPEFEGNADSKDTKITPIKGDTNDSSFDCNIENTNPSQKVGQDAIYGHHRLTNNFHSLYKTNENEKAHFEDQIDGLSRHVGAVDLKLEMRKELSDDSLSRFHVICPDSSAAPEFSCSREIFLHGQKEESLNNLLKPSPLSLSPTTLEITAGTRSPFVVKNSFCNKDGLFDFSTDSTVEVVEKIATLPYLESAQKENS